MGKPARTLLHIVLLFTLCPCAFAQSQRHPPHSGVNRDVDPDLARFIASVQAIDNHAHPVLPPPALASDREFDALPVDSMEPQTDAVALRSDNPQLASAWKALWGFTGTPPLNDDQSKRLQAARESVRTARGSGYDTWVLDQSGVGTQLANRVRMGTGIAPPRFQWVPYDDALLFPLNNSALAASTPDKAMFFPLEAKVLALYLQNAHQPALPPTLDEYITGVVLPTLQVQHAGGAVAIKFEIAYLRGFNFAASSHDDAARIYAQNVGRPAPSAADYKLLQDYLFRFIAGQAGTLNMAVHLHTMAGAGSYFSIADANPMLLEPVFNDPQLRRSTNFVMLHGGWPFVHEAGSLLQKPNVYLDLSQQSIMFPPHTLATWLREWLELYPEKVLYATDAYPYSDALGWEESLWIADHNVREALGIALTGMLRDGEINRTRAQAIATMVLRGNAARLYHLDPRAPRVQ